MSCPLRCSARRPPAFRRPVCSGLVRPRSPCAVGSSTHVPVRVSCACPRSPCVVGPYAFAIAIAMRQVRRSRSVRQDVVRRPTHPSVRASSLAPRAPVGQYAAAPRTWEAGTGRGVVSRGAHFARGTDVSCPQCGFGFSCSQCGADFRYARCREASAHSSTVRTVPAPTVRPPSRMAKPRPVSSGTSRPSSTDTVTVSPGRATPRSPRSRSPTTSAVRM